MAAGAYLRARKAGMAFASNVARSAAGEVVDMLGGPRREVEECQVSRRPHVLRMSSIRASVSCSEEVL
jgi:hypothetical protein